MLQGIYTTALYIYVYLLQRMGIGETGVLGRNAPVPSIANTEGKKEVDLA